MALTLAGTAVAGFALVGPAQAAPLWPGGPDIPGVPAIIPPPPPGTAPQPGPLPAPPAPLPGSTAPSVLPGNGEVVGGKRAIDITYKTPVVDRAAAEKSIRVTSSTNTPGHFNWVNDSHVQWVPNDYWPRDASVTVDAAGTRSAFKVSDDFSAVSDARAHNFVVKIGGDVVRTFPASLGKKGHETPNGTYPVLSKEPMVVMDSSTYGVPVDSPQGYKLKVYDAERLTSDGVYVHAAPWSVDQQGHSNVSHGCINLSPAAAKWYFDNVRIGDKVTVVNS